MLNEVLRLTKGDLTNVTKDEKEKEEREQNNEAFYKDYKGEAHD